MIEVSSGDEGLMVTVRGRRGCTRQEVREMPDSGGVEPNVHFGTHEFSGKQYFKQKVSIHSWPGMPVVAGITEIDQQGNSLTGSADMEVHNVSPYNNEVWVTGRILWDSPLRARLTVMAPGG
jgi:hypothetical protein